MEANQILFGAYLSLPKLNFSYGKQLMNIFLQITF